MMRRFHCAAALCVLLVAGDTRTEDSGEGGGGACAVDATTCALHDDSGPWSTLLQEWALTASEHSGRQGRIMALPPSKGYYVTDRIDLAPPPPPPSHHHSSGPSHPGQHHQNAPVPPPGGRPYDEWQHTPPPPPGVSKIVNRPPYKDKFKPSPSYNPQPPNQPIPVYDSPPQYTVDRVDENKPSPQKQVSETDLYLLGAIEKLVYRADLMEKRLRKLEESVHYLVAGVDKKPEPCATNFTRVGGGCYHISLEEANWKGANYACRRLKANMLELDTDKEFKKLMSALLAENKHRGDDFWTGGLNPGLLWIWSHSARPVASNSTSAASDGTQSASVVGEGRCLAWVSDPALGAYVYRGQDCSLRHRYICEKEEDKTKLSNEIERVAKMLKEGRQGRRAKIVWTEDET